MKRRTLASQSPVFEKVHANFLLPLEFSAEKIQISYLNRCLFFPERSGFRAASGWWTSWEDSPCQLRHTETWRRKNGCILRGSYSSNRPLYINIFKWCAAFVLCHFLLHPSSQSHQNLSQEGILQVQPVNNWAYWDKHQDQRAWGLSLCQNKAAEEHLPSASASSTTSISKNKSPQKTSILSIVYP